jgi:hypothetical protein
VQEKTQPNQRQPHHVNLVRPTKKESAARVEDACDKQQPPDLADLHMNKGQGFFGLGGRCLIGAPVEVGREPHAEAEPQHGCASLQCHLSL